MLKMRLNLCQLLTTKTLLEHNNVSDYKFES